MPDPQTRIAALVLSGTIERAVQRNPEERSEDVRIALELAAEVLRQRRGGSPVDFVHDNPKITPRLVPTTKERVEVKEDLAPLNDLLAGRRGAHRRPTSEGPKTRSLH